MGDEDTRPTAGTWTITGDAIENGTDNVSGAPAGYGGDGIGLDSTSNPVTISGNTLLKNPEYGIVLA